MAPVHGLHLIVTGIIKDGTGPVQERTIRDYLLELTELIGMEVLDGPLTARVNDNNSDNSDNSGTTGIILLNTSHASIHTRDESPEFPAYLEADIYSCRGFDQEPVLDLLEAKFSLVSISFDPIDRDPSKALALNMLRCFTV